MNVTKKYHGQPILTEVTYEFPKKGFVCLLGESGVGKSTLLNMLAGLDTDYQGEVVIGQKALREWNEEQLANYRKDTIGFIFQDYQLLDGYTALENCLYPTMIQSMTPEEAEKQAIKYLEQMGLGERIHQKIETLSGGQKQRVALARALMNQPQVILADEPTGALDRENAEEVMTILKKISEERLVVIITHDPHICQYADEVIAIENQQIIITESDHRHQTANDFQLELKKYPKTNTRQLALKQFRVSMSHYLVIALMIAVGGICTLFTLSANQIIGNSITDFQEKNIVLTNGYVRVEEGQMEDVFQRLTKDERVDNVYKQYVLKDINLKMDEKSIELLEKYPMPRGEERFSYGVMPRIGKNEIALSGPFAKQFSSKISDLVGKKVTLEKGKQKEELTISGIYNASYDDFYISSDFEKNLYQGITNLKDYYSISFDVKSFEEVSGVSEMLNKKNIAHQMSVKEVETMLQSFNKIKNLFLIVASLVVAVCLLLTIILLGKLQASRKQMVGLLSALGFNRKMTGQILWHENVLLAVLTVLILAILMVFVSLISSYLRLGLIFSVGQILGLFFITFIGVISIGFIINQRTFQASTIRLLKG